MVGGYIRAMAIILRQPNRPDTRIVEGPLADEVGALNACLNQHRFEFIPDGWTASVRFRPKYRRIFHGDLETHGRWYARAQEMSKSERRTIVINGEPTVELDIASCQMRIILNHLGHPAPADAYRLPGVPAAQRKKFKQATIVALNCDSRATAEYSLAQWLTRAGLRPEQAPRVLDRVESHLPNDVRDVLYSSSSGWAMHLDSQVCAGVFRRFVRIGAPVLGVHDAWLVPASLERTLYLAIQASYREVLGGWDPVLKRSGPDGKEEFVDDDFYGLGSRRAGQRE